MNPPGHIISTTAKSAEVARAVSSLPFLFTGRRTLGVSNFVKVLQVRIGLAALSRIKEAFIIKSRGGSDDTGLRWPPLKPATIAYGRRHPMLSRTGQATKRRIPTQKKRAEYRPSWMLTEKQRGRWWSLYVRYVRAFKGDKAHAAAAAWRILKSEGARTLIGVYGNMPAEILRDTGVLLNSLSPGVPESSLPDSPPRVYHQVFRLGRGEVIIGTNRQGAAAHHRGVPGRLPQRRLWPDPKTWPSAWWNDILKVARDGVIDIVEGLLQRR